MKIGTLVDHDPNLKNLMIPHPNTAPDLQI